MSSVPHTASELINAVGAAYSAIDIRAVAIRKDDSRTATDGELFWYITRGDVNTGMPAWESLPEQQRWQIVTYVKGLGGTKTSSTGSHAAATTAEPANLPPPKAPFTDYRFEAPARVRKITLQDLPAPFETSSVGNGPKLVPRPESAWPKVLENFKVQQYANQSGRSEADPHRTQRRFFYRREPHRADHGPTRN